MKLVRAVLPNSAITWMNEVPEVPKTTERQGNVTINNMGSPGRPGYFDVSFSISATFAEGGVETTLYVTPSIIVLGKNKSDPLNIIEEAGMAELGKVFRALADAMDRQFAEYNGSALLNNEGGRTE